jgi:hypothetical protein
LTAFTGAATLIITEAPVCSSGTSLKASLTITETVACTGGIGTQAALTITKGGASTSGSGTGAALGATLGHVEADSRHTSMGAALTVTQGSVGVGGTHQLHGNAALTILFTPAEFDTHTGTFVPGTPLRAFPTVRYPANPITPAGGYHLLADRLPMVAYRSYDDTVVFNMMGGLAIADPTTPERVELLDIKGLVPPWQNIEQKGASEDGTTYVTSLYDPLEVDITVMARGRNPMFVRKVVRDWIASWDAKQAGTLSWWTQELGYWWAPIQWGKQPNSPLTPTQELRQKFTWSGKAYNAFWRSYDSTDVFAYSYLAATDTFNVDYSGSNNLGPNWTIAYNGIGTGILTSHGTGAISTLISGASATAQRTGYVSASDEQIITITLGSMSPWPQDPNTSLDIWARMANSGTPGQNGIRLRIGYTKSGTGKNAGALGPSTLKLSYFVGGVETVLKQTTVTIPWQPTDQISLAVGGFSGLLNSYYVQRGTNSSGGTTKVAWSSLMTVTHSSSDGSLVGPNYRGAGFGMKADGTASPPSIVSWTAGDSTAAEESGYLTLYNAGDQAAWPFYILVGPGLFGIGDGPNATQAVTYGPLEENQMVYIQTDPRKYAVTDLTSMPPPGTPASNQFLSGLTAALAAYNSFLSNGAPAPNLSVFGTPFPQGNPYSLLNGRFSNPVPAKSPGASPQPQQIAVAVESGGPGTAVLAGLTPLRRYPQ